MTYCVVDYESRSQCDLKRRGTWNYSVDPTTEPLCFAYKFENEPAVVIPRERIPTCRDEIRRVISADVIHAHASFFEQCIFSNICTPRYGWPQLPFEKLRCSAALAAMHSLPRSLEGAGSALGLPIQKDAEGHRLMLKMSKPRKPRKGEDPNGIYWHESPEDLARLYSYCARDVEAEEMLVRALRPLPERELKIWRLDQEINRRGFAVDVAACRAMIAMVDEHTKHLEAQLADLTDGAVRTGKQTAALLEFLRGLGVDLPDLAAETVTTTLEDADEPLDPKARAILEIRRSLARSSSAKYDAMIRSADSQGRVRDTLRYHGAGTGRWAGRAVQPQNFPSRIKTSGGPEDMLRAVMVGGLSLFNMCYGDDPMAAAGAITRSAIIAGPGMEFVCADLSSIEGRGLAWLAGEQWVLDEYRRIDAEGGPDMYMVAAGKILGIPAADVKKADRDLIGKPAELYCIAAGMLVRTEKHGNVPIEKVTTEMRVWDGVEWVAHEGAIFRGVKSLMKYRDLFATDDHRVYLPFVIESVPMRDIGHWANRDAPVWDLVNCGPRHRFMVAGQIVANCGYGGSVGAVRRAKACKEMDDDEVKERVIHPWRESHPMTVACWEEFENASIEAVRNPGLVTVVRNGLCYFKMCADDKFLKMRLPSGRILFYYDAKMAKVKTPWGTMKDSVTYMTVDSITNQWVRTASRGAKFVENAVQGLCRDILVDGMFRTEEAGYPTVLTCHDELLSEVPIGFGSVAEFEDLMTIVPSWAPGLPLKAKGWRGARYRK